MNNIKYKKRERRHKKIRAKIKGTSGCLRLCVFKSIKHIYAQIIDSDKGKTLVSASDLEIKAGTKTARKQVQKDSKEEIKGKVKIAFEVGRLIAEKALKEKIDKVVFDRGGFAYHGRIKALADGAREGGLKF